MYLLRVVRIGIRNRSGTIAALISVSSTYSRYMERVVLVSPSSFTVKVTVSICFVSLLTQSWIPEIVRILWTYIPFSFKFSHRSVTKYNSLEIKYNFGKWHCWKFLRWVATLKIGNNFLKYQIYFTRHAANFRESSNWGERRDGELLIREI